MADLELAGADVAAPGYGPDEVGSLEEAVSAFERSLLQRLLPQYPSTRKLAARLRSSHTAIAARLRR